MALVQNLLNRMRIGENITTPRQDLFGEQRISSGDTLREPGRADEIGKPIPTGVTDADQCPSGQHWDARRGRCVADGGLPDDIDGAEPPKLFICPDGRHVKNPSECNQIGTAGDETGLTCPEGQHLENGVCVGDSPDEPDCVPQPWSPSADTVAIGQSFEQTDGCQHYRQAVGTKDIDPTPPTDPIDEFTGGFGDGIEDEGGDIDDFYDRFPVDYTDFITGQGIGRFGSQFNRPNLEGLEEELDINIKDKYRKFFPDYDPFLENLSSIEFGVGRKGLTADLFDLTRQSQRARQQQGLLSGFPREFERLGRGRTGRQFQALDTAFRKDIFGKRQEFGEEAIDRLLDLIKGGAEPFTQRSDTPDQFEEAKGTGNPVVDDNGKTWTWDGTQWVDAFGNPGDPQINTGDTG